ncbi:hypothetical protein BDF21DRAFT_439225 [Thamnidium elegans]|nr:hypothetical protein BDF21DRAFT_439225 [Thamnidium elegans]
MKTAIIAASRAKYQNIHSESFMDQDTLKRELYNVRKLKLETKLHQARKEMKKEKKEEEDKDEEEKEKKPVKKVTAQDIEQYENELEILKNIDLEQLVEKTIKSKLLKHNTLKHEELVKDLIESSMKPTEKSDQVTQNIESRLISQKPVVTEVTNMMTSFQSIIKGNNEKIEKKKAEEAKKKKMEEAKKRKAEEAEKDKLNNKKPKMVAKSKPGTSEFIETLGDDENEDENFQKIYEGEKKPNRVGQKQRRKQWEEKYGREANHIAAEFKKREEKRLANPDYRPKKKPAPKHVQTSSAPAEPVHPSWEAKRLQEEIMSKALSGRGGPSNNKIVFDDSD